MFPWLVFLLCVPPCFLVGVTLIGQARPLPYSSVWIDRALLAATTLGIPAFAAFLLRRRLSRSAGRRL